MNPIARCDHDWSVVAGAVMVMIVGGVGACSGGGPELRETAKIAASSPEALGIPDPSQARQRRVARLEVQVPYLRQKVDSLQAEWLALVALGESTGRVLEHHGGG